MIMKRTRFINNNGVIYGRMYGERWVVVRCECEQGVVVYYCEDISHTQANMHNITKEKPV